MIILPPVDPANSLKMSYNKAKKVDDMPFVYDQDRPSFGAAEAAQAGVIAQGYESHGMNWYFNDAPDQFQYNMPPLKHLPTSQPASRPIIEKTDSYPGKKNKEAWEKKKWEWWRTSIVGVNKYMKPDESNPEETGVQNMSCQYGGWTELVAYQANCVRWHGLNCICDYMNNFWRGSSLGYALYRSSVIMHPANVYKENEQMTNVQSSYTKYTQQKTILTKDQGYKVWERNMDVIKADRIFKALMGHDISSKPWPGEGGWLMTGLSNAKKGDIIIWDSTDKASLGHKRPYHAAYVEEKDPNGCLIISESNNGVIRDSCENTENWGKVTSRRICQSPDSGYSFTDKDGGGGMKHCGYSQFKDCYEGGDWGKWKVYRYFADNRKRDGSTGTDCKTREKQVETNITKIRGIQDEKAAQPLVDQTNQTIDKLIADGCNPSSPTYQQKGLALGSSSITKAKYTPSAPGQTSYTGQGLFNLNPFGFNIQLPAINISLDPTTLFGGGGDSGGGDSGGSSGGGSNTPVLQPKSCGETAVEALELLKKDSDVTYKEGCAGDSGSSDQPGTACNGKEIGRFGLIDSAYNNTKQTIDVSTLVNNTPALASSSNTSIIAFKNLADGTSNEPNGCRITSLSSCAKAGDIVLVHSNPAAASGTPYDRFLIYDGVGGFYEVKNQSYPIQRGALDSVYANSSYEVRRLACNN
jgi:hypothetical protein